MSRTYKIGKENYVSVTTVIGDYDTGGLMQWAANCAIEYVRENLLRDIEEGWGLQPTDWDKARYAYKKISKEATDIGTEVHDAIEGYIKAWVEKQGTPYLHVPSLDSDNDAQVNGYNAFFEWKEQVQPIFIDSELTVHSDTYKYAGTLDCVCRLDGKLYIIDFKTSKKHYPKNAVQIAAYKYAYEEMTGEFVDGVGVLRLDKVTGEYDWKDYTKVVVRQMDTFLGLLKAWNNFKKRRGM